MPDTPRRNAGQPSRKVPPGVAPKVRTLDGTHDRLLTVEQAAARLNTGVRFVRRLIAERRITFVHVGRHVRIAESVLDAFIAEGTVAPVPIRRRGRAA